MNVKNRYGNWDRLQRPLLLNYCTLYFLQHPTLVLELERFIKTPDGSFGGSIDVFVMLLVPAPVLDALLSTSLSFDTILLLPCNLAWLLGCEVASTALSVDQRRSGKVI